MSLDFSVALARLDARLNDTMAVAMKPHERSLPSEWAENNIHMPSGSTALPGDLRLFRYQKGIMDATVEPGVNELAVIKGSRTGYNQILAALQCYWLATTRDPVVSIHPTAKSSRQHEEKYIRPMIENSKALLALFPDLDKQRWDVKTSLTGSSIMFKEAGKPSGFAEYPARFISGDENDRPQWADGGNDISEGDKIDMMEMRLATFTGREIMLNGSSPGLERTSRILPRYLLTDQRRLFVPCYHCLEGQVLEWGGRGVGYGVEWNQGDAANAFYRCRHCGKVILEKHRRETVEVADWRPTAVGLPGKIGFHLPGLVSPFLTLGKLAVDFEKAARMASIGRTGSLQTFTNTKLGEAWQEPEAKRATGVHELEARCETYAAEVPADCLFILASADTQEGKQGEVGYSEVSFYGVGKGEQLWLLAHIILREHGLDDNRHWKQLGDLLSRKWKHASGREMVAIAASIDTGGLHGQRVVDFCNAGARLGKKWWPIKGRSNIAGERKPPLWPTSVSKYKAGGYLYIIDTYIARDAMFEQLHERQPGEPGSIHFPSNEVPGSVKIDAAFFKRLTKERPRVVPGQDGTSWAKQPRDQEPWDCLVYVYATLHGLYSMKGGHKISAALNATASSAVMVVEPSEDDESPEAETLDGQETAAPEPAGPVAPALSWKRTGIPPARKIEPVASPAAPARRRGPTMVRSSFVGG